MCPLGWTLGPVLAFLETLVSVLSSAEGHSLMIWMKFYEAVLAHNSALNLAPCAVDVYLPRQKERPLKRRFCCEISMFSMYLDIY